MMMMTMMMMLSAHLEFEMASPSFLHSTTTVEEGGGVTWQGRITVCPTRPSIEEGSDLSMLTARLLRENGGHTKLKQEQQERHRKRQRKK